MHVKVHWIALDPPGRLGLMPRPPAHEHLGEGLRAIHALGVDRLVSLLEPDNAALLGLEQEEATCRELGIDFTSFPIKDFGVPHSEDAFWAAASAIHEDLRAGRSVVVHCMTGVGRSGMLTSGVLVLVGLAPLDAVACVSQARGAQVPETAEQRAWFLEAARRREPFMEAPHSL